MEMEKIYLHSGAKCLRNIPTCFRGNAVCARHNGGNAERDIVSCKVL